MLQETLESLFQADRTARESETSLLRAKDRDELVTALERATEAAFDLDDQEESEARLERLADLSGQVGGRTMVDNLIRILNHSEPSVRVSAGEALLDLGYERYAELARSIERRLEQSEDGPAMAELPWILGEIGEPSALPLVRRFLAREDADTVAAAIEVLATLGDPAAVQDLEKFAADGRVVTLEDAEMETEATIGELAKEAIGVLKDGA